MALRIATLALTSSVLLQGTNAWGTLGHETVAFVAQHYVKSSTASWAKSILGSSSSSSYLASVATWADSYRYTSAGKFSAPYHFIDAQDNPPNSCNVDYDRDCTSGGCVVSAIANYTARVQSASLPASEVQMALKWIVHFLGDITQPLHDENYELGGNGVDVTYNGTSRNLHSSWDTYIPETLVGGYSLADAQSWANDLIQDISSGKYESQKSSWVSGLDVTDPVGTAMGWATDANAFVCTDVVPDGWDAVEGTELYPDYYNSVIDTVELQIAKGGYRLAKWLDAIAAQAGASKMIKKDLAAEASLDGSELLPRKRELTPAQRRRAAIADGGCGCDRHAH